MKKFEKLRDKLEVRAEIVRKWHYFFTDITGQVFSADTRYWSVTLENVWHECLEPLVRRSSVTDKGVDPGPDGIVRLSIGARDRGEGYWLDTGGRRRGFIVVRWLDNPTAPEVTVSLRDDGSRP